MRRPWGLYSVSQGLAQYDGADWQMDIEPEIIQTTAEVRSTIELETQVLPQHAQHDRSKPQY